MEAEGGRGLLSRGLMSGGLMSYTPDGQTDEIGAITSSAACIAC